MCVVACVFNDISNELEMCTYVFRLFFCNSTNSLKPNKAPFPFNLNDNVSKQNVFGRYKG